MSRLAASIGQHAHDVRFDLLLECQAVGLYLRGSEGERHIVQILWSGRHSRASCRSVAQKAVQNIGALVERWILSECVVDLRGRNSGIADSIASTQRCG